MNPRTGQEKGLFLIAIDILCDAEYQSRHNQLGNIGTVAKLLDLDVLHKQVTLESSGLGLK
jgi:hypothetical protein